MASLIVAGDTSGTVTLQAPDIAGSTVLTLPATSGTIVTTGGGASVPFAAGSAASPSITFTGDTNTGIFSPAADTIAFAEGGVESMRITSAGNVGIGTSSPRSLLDITTTTSDALINLDSGSGKTSFLEFRNLGANKAYLGLGGFTGGSNNDLSYYVSGAGNAIFYTSGTERMRIASGGELLVATTTTPVSGYSCFSKDGGDVQIILQRTGSGAGYGAIGGSGANALNVYGSTGGLSQRFLVSQAGSCFNITGTYGTISDIKVKENIEDARNYLDDLCKVRIVKYSLKADAKESADKLGVIAQELEQIFPNMIEEQPDVIDGKEVADTTTKSVKYSVFVPMLIKAIQEQQAIIQSQADTITAMEARLTALENK
jgi:hypothetical protein